MKRSIFIFILVLSICLPLFINDPYITHLCILSGIYILLASFWNLLDGYLGIINFGFAAFFGLGAYTSGIVSVHLKFPLFLSIPLAGFVSAFLCFLITIPCLRMGVFSVAIVTLAFGETIRILISLWHNVTGGPRGFWGIPPIFEGPSRLPYFWTIIVLLIIFLTILWKIITSYWGLIFRSIREDEIAANSLGIDVNKYKMLGSIISCFAAGIIGGFYSHYILTITPAICGIPYTVTIMAMSLIGGRGTFWGPIIGGFSLIFLGESIRFLENFRFLIYGLIIICVTVVFPRGLSGTFELGKQLILKARKKRV